MIRYVMRLAGIAFFMWFWCFLAFFVYVKNVKSSYQGAVDAVVVLTGRVGRIQEGNTAVQKGLAPRLFISGVSPKVSSKDLADKEHVTQESLGYYAQNTVQNAEEIQAWQKEYGWKSIRLVTDAVHMPRSLLEVRLLVPYLHVVPHAVFYETSLKTYLKEFHKFVAAFFVYRLKVVGDKHTLILSGP